MYLQNAIYVNSIVYGVRKGVPRKAYDDASRAIHAGELKHTKLDKHLLPTAQAFCLRGILKRLEDSEAPAWDELILGGCPEDHADQP